MTWNRKKVASDRENLGVKSLSFFSKEKNNRRKTFVENTSSNFKSIKYWQPCHTDGDHNRTKWVQDVRSYT